MLSWPHILLLDIKSCTRIIPEKFKSMAQCQANAGPTLKVVYHLCGSIGPMSRVSRYLLWQCNAISHTMAHANREPVNTRRRTNVGQMLARHRRRRANINPTPDQRLVSAGMSDPIRISWQKNWQYWHAHVEVPWPKHRCCSSTDVPDTPLPHRHKQIYHGNM